MGFRCPICRTDFKTDKAAFEKHLKNQCCLKSDLHCLTLGNFANLTKTILSEGKNDKAIKTKSL